MKIIEITFMHPLQQYYCDTCYGDWFALGLVVIIALFLIIGMITVGIQDEAERKRKNKVELERRIRDEAERKRKNKVELERRRYEASPEYQEELRIRKLKVQKENEQEIAIWKWKYPFAWNADTVFENSLSSIGKSLPVCNNCNGSIMRIWQLAGDFIILRCEICKKKHNYNQLYFDSKNSSSNSQIESYHEVKLSSFFEKYKNYVNRRNNAPIQNPLYSSGKPLGDYNGMTKAHPETYPYKIKCQLAPLKGRRTKSKINNEDVRSRRISQEVKDAVWNRDGGKCAECGSNENLEFDHIIPWSKGGANTYRNLQLLCESCNRFKSDKIG